MAAIERRTAAEADLEPDSLYGPFLNPPFFALAYVPFAALPYREAALAWLILNFALIGGSVVLLCRMLPAGADWRTKTLVPLLLVLPIPFWQAMCHQQNTFVSLFLLCAIVTLWRRALPGMIGRQHESDMAASSPAQAAFFAGVATGLFFYKPQLALVVSLSLVTTLGLPALLGLSLSGVALLLLTVVWMPGTLHEYLHRLPPVIYWMQQQLGYNWGRQVTPQAFWRVLLQGHVRGPTALVPRILAAGCTIAAAAGLIISVWRFHRGGRVVPDDVIAATILSMPLLMPYYMDYDLLLLAVPAVLFAGQWTTSPDPRAQLDRWQLGLWVALFLGLYAGPGTASHTRLHPSVILIAFAAAAAQLRCLRHFPRRESFPDPTPPQQRLDFTFPRNADRSAPALSA